MHPSSITPRHVTIGDAASFVGTTPQIIRHYQQIGLLAEPVQNSDDPRLYGYKEIIRLLWIRAMADAGVAPDDICDACADFDRDVAGIGSRMALLSDVVTDRFEGLPDGSLRREDLDTLLVTERIFGPLGAAVQATRFLAVATHPGLREESDRVDDAEGALDDTIAVDDPRVAQVAAERQAFERMLHAVIEESGLGQSDEALFDSWDASHPVSADDVENEAGQHFMSAFEAVGMMPYDFSPARLRCMDLAVELEAQESSTS